jgi:hypothetical protein
VKKSSKSSASKKPSRTRLKADSDTKLLLMGILAVQKKLDAACLVDISYFMDRMAEQAERLRVIEGDIEKIQIYMGKLWEHKTRREHPTLAQDALRAVIDEF